MVVDRYFFPRSGQGRCHRAILDSVLSTKILILPGIGNFGPQHWQNLWEVPPNPRFQRGRAGVEQQR